MIKIQNIIGPQLNGVSGLTLNVATVPTGTRTLNIAFLEYGVITDAEYTKNPDYYNGLKQKGDISMTSDDTFNDVLDEPDNASLPMGHQIGSAVSGVNGPLLD